jgi:hypothetical protein
MSKKLLAFFLMIGLCCAAAAAAQEQKGSALSEWLRSIQKKMDKILPKKEITTSTGVAGVRGARQEAQTKLYWKGKKGETSVSEEELGKFKTCVELAGKGECAAASKELEAFMKQYPESPLIPDAKKTLDLVMAEPKKEKIEEKKAEQKPEEQRENKKAEPIIDKKEETKKAE